MVVYGSYITCEPMESQPDGRLEAKITGADVVYRVARAAHRRYYYDSECRKINLDMHGGQ